jgi:hypothetical protein
MKSQIRVARPGDAPSFISIKNQLSFTQSEGSTSKGGFLLGTDIATYREYINEAFCLVAEVDGEVVGFGIIFSDEMLRASDVWNRRHQANWFIDLPQYEHHRLCYFEQLAFLPGHRRLVISLAYHLVKRVFDRGYQTLLTTTVREPILNLAAIPFIRTVSGIHAGNIDEEYPLIGRIKSDIYLLEASSFYEQTAKHPLLGMVEGMTII